MPSPKHLAAAFREADRPFRPRHLAQFWVVCTALKDPVLAVEIHAELVSSGGTPHAAARFALMLREARDHGIRFWRHQVLLNRRPAPLPA